MNLIEKIRNKSHGEKMRIIWITAAAVAILMIIVWVLSAGYYKHVKTDTSLFDTIGQGVKDIKNNYRKK